MYPSFLLFFYILHSEKKNKKYKKALKKLSRHSVHFSRSTINREKKVGT